MFLSSSTEFTNFPLLLLFTSNPRNHHILSKISIQTKLFILVFIYLSINFALILQAVVESWMCPKAVLCRHQVTLCHMDTANTARGSSMLIPDLS